MNRGLIVICILFALIIAGQGHAQPAWEVSYGTETNQVAVFNSKTDPKFAEDAPYGPMAFRVFAEDLWVLDSIGGKILCLNQKNELKSSVVIPALEGFKLLEDFALISGASGAPESVWVAEAGECSIRKISLASGKELLRVGGRGNEAGKFLQINQIEVDAAGRLFVGDYGRSVIAIFTAYGELIREIPWQHSGFALDKRGRLHLLAYRDNAGYFHRVYSPRGQLLQSSHVGLASLQNARLWGVSDEGIMASFIPEGGFKGQLHLLEISAAGSLKRKFEFVPPGSMNRFLASVGQKLFLAEADFFAAPEGKFHVKNIEWDVKK